MRQTRRRSLDSRQLRYTRSRVWHEAFPLSLSSSIHLRRACAAFICREPQMSSSFSGAQLPLTAFFNPRSAQESKGKSAKPKVAARRTEQASGQDRDQEPPRKKQKQKENVTPRTINSSSRNVFDKQAGGSRSRANVHSAVPHIGEDPGEDELVAILSPPEARSRDNDSHREVIDVDVPPSGLGNKSSTLASSHRQAPVTPKLDKRLHPLLAAASLPSPPPTAPTYKRARDVRHEESSPSHAEGRSSYPDLEHSSPHPQETGSCNSFYQLVHGLILYSNPRHSNFPCHCCAGCRGQRRHCASVSSKRERDVYASSSLTAQSILSLDAYTPCAPSTSVIIFRPMGPIIPKPRIVDTSLRV